MEEPRPLPSIYHTGPPGSGESELQFSAAGSSARRLSTRWETEGGKGSSTWGLHCVLSIGADKHYMWDPGLAQRKSSVEILLINGPSWTSHLEIKQIWLWRRKLLKSLKSHSYWKHDLDPWHHHGGGGGWLAGGILVLRTISATSQLYHLEQVTSLPCVFFSVCVNKDHPPYHLGPLSMRWRVHSPCTYKIDTGTRSVSTMQEDVFGEVDSFLPSYCMV